MPVSDFTRRVLDRFEQSTIAQVPPTDFTARVLQRAGIKPIRAERIEETERVAEEARIRAERRERPLGLAIETAKEIPEVYERKLKGIPRFVKGAFQAINRNLASVGITVATYIAKPEEKKELREGVVDLTKAPFLFGSEKIEESLWEAGTSPKPLEQRVVAAESEIKKWGEERKDTALGKFASEKPELLAFPVIMGMAALDLTPFGGLEKNALRALVKTKTAGEAIKVLVKMGVADDLARNFADDVVKATNTKQAKALFDNIVEVQRTTRVARPTVEIAPKIAREIPPELQPLAREARKYKSAEEFVNAITGKPNFFEIVDPKIQQAVKQGKRFPTEESIKKAFPEEWARLEKVNAEQDRLFKLLKEAFPGKPIYKNALDLSKKEFTDFYNLAKGVEKLPVAPKVPAKAVPRAMESIPDVIRGKKGVDPFVRVERGFIVSAKEAIPELKIAGQYIPRTTDRLAIKAKNLIIDDIATAERLALTGTDDKAVATASELIKHYSKLAAKATEAEKIAFYDKAAEIAVKIAPKLTKQGRAIQAASILGSQTPEGQLRFAARTIQKYNEAVEATKGGILGLRKKVPELTGEQAKSISKRMNEIKNMPDGVDKAIAFKKLQDEIADLIPSSWYKKVINLWKAGLLTGLKTSGLNDFSNLFHGISEIIKDIPAVAVDNVVSLFTKERTLALTVRGVKGGVGEGFEKGIAYMKTGFDERHMAAKLDWRRVSFGKSKFAKAVQTYEETVFHWMGAQDQPFYYGAKARSVVSQAIAQGKNKGLKGKELGKFVDNLIQNPTDDIIRYAANDGEISVFQNRTVLGKVARAIQKVPGGEVVVPFGRTPSAVAMQIINYSPVGIVKTFVENIGKGRFNQRLFSQGIGRGVTGTAAIFIGMKMYKNNMISLDYPTTEAEKNLWELEGRKANAIKIGDKWRSVLPLGPGGMLLILGGQLQQSLDENGSLSQSLLEAGPATAKSFTEQTFLVGINQFAKALNDPGRYAVNVAARTAGSTIPTIISDVGRAVDPLERRDYARTEGFEAPFIARVPIARQTLEPRIDVFGSPLARGGNALETIIDPTRPTRIKSNELVEELRRLFDIGFPATPTRFADERTYTDVLTSEQITYLQEKAGLILEEKLKNLIAHPEYKKLDDDAKMRKIQNFTNRARVDARAEMVEELIRDLEREELGAKLSELKNEGFMTRQVFDEWQKLFGVRDIIIEKREEVVPKARPEDRSIFDLVSDYVRAFITDPQNAFRALFTREKLGVVKGNLVELQRFYGIRFDDKGGSEEFKRGLMEKEGIPLDDIENWKLEHITPVKAGGSSAETNLMLVNNEMHDFFTPIDIAVGNAVKDKRITRKQAEELMRDFKVNKTVTAEEVILFLGG